MTKIFIGFALIITFLPLGSVEKTVVQKTADLKKRLQQVSGKEKVEVLNELAHSYQRQSPEKFKDYSQQALILSNKLNYTKGKAIALKNIGIGYRLSAENKRALEYLRRALKIFKELDDKKNVADSIKELGLVYLYISEFETALEYFLKSLRIGEEIKDKSVISKSSNNIGIVYFHLRHFDKALEYYSRALRMDEELGNKSGIADSYYNIGIIQVFLKNYDSAEENYLKALEIFEELGTKEGLADCYLNLGIVHAVLKEYDKSEKYLLESLEIAEEIGWKWRVAVVAGNLGECYLGQKKYDKALFNLKKGLDLAKEIDAKDVIRDGYRAFSYFYSARGDYKKALEYHRLYFEINGNMFNEKSSKQIADMQTRYETEKKEMEIEALRRQNRIKTLENRVQIFVFVSLVVVLVIILFVIFRYYRHYKDEMKRREERQRKLQLESRLKILQARINPHFLFNSLDAVIGLGYRNDPHALKETVGKLADMYRRILSAPESPTVALKEELVVVQDYLEIEKKILKDRLEFNISVDDQDLLNIEMIPLSILTLVENAVKHGVSRKVEGGTIQVDIYEKDRFVFVEVTDSGVGFDVTAAKSGFGLYSIQERLRLYYRGMARFSIKALKEGGTRALLQIPCGAA